jgi:hypothetical protein
MHEYMTSNYITDLLSTTVVIEGGSFQTGPPEKELSPPPPPPHPWTLLPVNEKTQSSKCDMKTTKGVDNVQNTSEF